MLSGGVGQVEAPPTVVGPAHELDSDLAPRGLDELPDLQTQTAVLHCSAAQTQRLRLVVQTTQLRNA